MGITVHERAPAFAVERHHVARARHVQLRELAEPLGELVGEVVDRHLHHRRATVAAARAARREPGKVAARREPARVPELAVQYRELLDDVAGAGLHVCVVTRREPATRVGEILQHHHVVVVGVVGRFGEIREPRTRHPHRQLPRQIAVHAGFCNTHALRVHELALARVERWKLDEHVWRHGRVSAQREAGAAGRARVPVDDLDLFDVHLERVRQECRRQVFDFER